MRARNRRLEKRSSFDEWSSAASKCIGSNHGKTGTPCQDSVFTKLFDNGVSVIALADGAGSSRYSHYGSDFITKRTVEFIGERFMEAVDPRCPFNDFKKRLIYQLQLELLELSESGINFNESERRRYGLPSSDEQQLVPCDIEDLSCTLLAIAIRENKYLAIHLGDGVIGSEIEIYGKRWMRAISVPDNGEFANETHFITSKEAADQTRGFYGRLDAAGTKTTGFILMSDGPEAVLFDKRKQTLAAACHKLLYANRVLSSEETSKRLETTLKEVVSQKTSDDCSIALMSRQTSR